MKWLPAAPYFELRQCDALRLRGTASWIWCSLSFQTHYLRLPRLSGLYAHSVSHQKWRIEWKASKLNTSGKLKTKCELSAQIRYGRIVIVCKISVCASTIKRHDIPSILKVLNLEICKRRFTDSENVWWHLMHSFLTVTEKRWGFI